jgi:predicted amidohydrolase
VRPDGLPVPDGRVRSATLVYAADGRRLGRYDKRHLFDVEVGDAQGRYQESLTYEPGDDTVLIDTPFGGLGVLTCYDLRFPEQARALRSAGADILVVPAAFTAVTGEAHWQVLLRARHREPVPGDRRGAGGLAFGAARDLGAQSGHRCMGHGAGGASRARPGAGHG